MPRQSGPHLGMLVGGVVVEHNMDDFADRDLRLDRVQEADELLTAVALHTTADDLAFEDIEGGEQRGRCGRAPGSAISRRPRARWRAPAEAALIRHIAAALMPTEP